MWISKKSALSIYPHLSQYYTWDFLLSCSLVISAKLVVPKNRVTQVKGIAFPFPVNFGF